MFEGLGLPCVRAEGEGEATCAQLNAQGLVDGCFTEDSDFFCYGGKTLYRNLRKEGGVYVVDKVSDVQDRVGLNQRDFVSLALLMGCDYNKAGVHSVGKEKAHDLIKLLKSRNLDVLARMIGWAKNEELARIEEEISEEIKKPAHCGKCDHLGRVSNHQMSGCCRCGSQKGCVMSGDIVCECDWHKQKQLIDRNILEIKIRRKSLKQPFFPDMEIIEEFLKERKDKFEDFSPVDVAKLIQWEKSVSVKIDLLEHVVPCFIFQQLWFPSTYPAKMYNPIRINRHCTEKFVGCYVVSWDKSDMNSWADETHSTNVELKIEKGLFERNYPGKVEQYEKSRMEEKSTKGKKRRLDSRQSSVLPFTKVKKKLEFSSNAAAAHEEQNIEFAHDNTVVQTGVCSVSETNILERDGDGENRDNISLKDDSLQNSSSSTCSSTHTATVGREAAEGDNERRVISVGSSSIKQACTAPRKHPSAEKQVTFSQSLSNIFKEARKNCNNTLVMKTSAKKGKVTSEARGQRSITAFLSSTEIH